MTLFLSDGPRWNNFIMDTLLLIVFMIYIGPSSEVVHQSQKGCVSDPADVVFLLDRSGSVGSSAFQTELQFIAEFAKHYVIGPRNVQIGVVTFSGSPKKEFDMKSFHDINELEKKVMNIKYNYNGTHTSTALKFVRENSFSTAAGDRPNVPNFLIVITDGQSRPAKFNPKTEAAKLHATNIEVFAIGVGSKIVIDELNVIGTDNQHVFTVNDHLNLHLPLREIRCEQFQNWTQLSTSTVPPTTTKAQLSTSTVPPATTKAQLSTSTVPPATTKGFIECMGCKRIPEPHDCRETILCAEHEQCSTDFYITPAGHVFYDVGCTSNRVCNAISQYGRPEHKRQDENVHICQECCDTDHCNRFGCSDKDKLNRTVCYSCLDVAHPSDCDEIKICDIDKKCFARHFMNDMFEERWTLGCEEKKKCSDIAKHSIFIGHPKRRRQIGGFNSLDICYYCCEDNFCNKYDCVKGLLPTTTTPLPQSNTSTSTGITHSYLNMTKGVSAGNVATTSVHSTSSQNFSTRKQTNIVTASPKLSTTTLTSSPGVNVSDTTTKAPPVAITNQTASNKTQSTLHAITTYLTTPAKKTQPTTSAINTHPTKSALTTHPTTHAITKHPTTPVLTTHPKTSDITTHPTIPAITTKLTTQSTQSTLPSKTMQMITPVVSKQPSTKHMNGNTGHAGLSLTALVSSWHTKTTLQPATGRASISPNTPGFISCYHCEYVNHESECNHTEICSMEGDQCYLTRVDGGEDNYNNCFYKMGCMSKRNCDTYTAQTRSRQNTVMVGSLDTVEYFECCTTSNCNEHVIIEHPAYCNNIPTGSS